MSETYIRGVVGGVTCGIISIFYSLSFAAVIFSGPLDPWLSRGISITFLSTAIGAAVFAARSSLKFGIAAPDTSTTAILAALAGAIANHLIDAGYKGADVIGPVVFMLSLSSLVTGLFLYGLGVTGAGRAIRFIPHPVIGGFLGATGWLMISGAASVTAGAKLDLSFFDSILNGATAAKLLAAIAVAVLIALARRRTSHPIAIPALLSCAAGLFFVITWALGLSLADAKENGWTFETHASEGLTLISPYEIVQYPWSLLVQDAVAIIAVTFVATIAMLLNTTGIELATKTEADLNQDLRSLGLANILSALLGGYISCFSLSRSSINFACGVRDRTAGYVVAIIAMAVLFVDPGFVAFVPKFVLGGLLLCFGFDLIWRWIGRSAWILPRTDYISLLLISAIIINFGFVAGVLVGIVIGCATFAVSASRINAIKMSFDGSQHHSSLERSADDLDVLSKFGYEIQGMILHSYLFFGTTNRLHQRVKELLATSDRIRFLVFDFRLVTGMDSSATQSFSQIKTAAERAGARIVFANLSDDIAEQLRSADVLTKEIHTEENLDLALERCESSLIAAHPRSGNTASTFEDWLGDALQDREGAAKLAASCRRLSLKAGDVIARQGEHSGSMHFILEGRVGIVVIPKQGEPVRVRSLGARTTVGEMGLITGQPRAATVEAEIDTEVYELSETTFRTLSVEDPALAQRLLGYVVRLLSERLSFANRSIGLLRQ